MTSADKIQIVFLTFPATSPTSPGAAQNMGSIKAFSAARKITKAMSYTTAAAGNVYEDDQSSQDSDRRFKANNTSVNKPQGFPTFKGKILVLSTCTPFL